MFLLFLLLPFFGNAFLLYEAFAYERNGQLFNELYGVILTDLNPSLFSVTGALIYFFIITSISWTISLTLIYSFICSLGSIPIMVAWWINFIISGSWFSFITCIFDNSDKIKENELTWRISQLITFVVALLSSILIFNTIGLAFFMNYPNAYFFTWSIHWINILINIKERNAVVFSPLSMIFYSIFTSFYPISKFGVNRWNHAYSFPWSMVLFCLNLTQIVILTLQKFYGSLFFLPKMFREDSYGQFLIYLKQ